LDPDAIWCEEFNVPGAPDIRHWKHDLGNNGGWGNYEVQSYNQTNAMVGEDDGKLHIAVTRSGDEFTSARIKTKDKVTFKYVRLEASIRIPNLEGGLWPAFWTIGQNFDTVGWPACGEIDIAEWGSEEAILNDKLHQLVSGAVHWDSTGNGTHAYESDSLTRGAYLNMGYHIYSLDWTPTTVTMLIDNILIFQQNITEMEAFHKPHFVILNVAVGGLFTGVFDPDSLGGEMLVDWIRAYDNGYNSTVEVAPCEECPNDYEESAATKSWSNSFAVLVTMASLLSAAASSV
jgi:beta-glucanase (GH16 family)